MNCKIELTEKQAIILLEILNDEASNCIELMKGYKDSTSKNYKSLEDKVRELRHIDNQVENYFTILDLKKLHS